MNLLVQAATQAPIAFRAGRDERREGTLGYIPGSTLWGGLAVAHTRLRADKGEEFAEFFLKGRIICGNLYPSKFSMPERRMNPLDAGPSPVRPLPRTARSCKRFSGFKFHADADADDRHGVWDSLIAWVGFVLGGGQNPANLDKLRDCVCGESLDTFSGFYRRGSAGGQWGAAEAKKGVFTRTGVSRARGAAAEGILYSREFLHSGSEFCGEWRVDDAIARDFQAFVEDASDGTLRVGHNRTRGLGKVAFSHLLQANADTVADIESRAKAFDAALRQSTGADARHGFYLPVTLTADCILPDAAGRYHLRITPEVLAEAWGVSGADLVYCNAGPRCVRGWNGLWGLPKTDEWAIAMGSVFLFGLPDTPNWQALAEGQARGLGTRRAEGFGAVRIADEFHWEVKGV